MLRTPSSEVPRLAGDGSTQSHDPVTPVFKAVAEFHYVAIFQRPCLPVQSSMPQGELSAHDAALISEEKPEISICSHIPCKICKSLFWVNRRLSLRWGCGLFTGISVGLEAGFMEG